MEKFTDKLIRLEHFVWRVVRFYFIAATFFFIGIIPGVLGFYLIEGHTFSESLLNALSMLGSQGLDPVPVSLSGKYFIAIYGVFLESVFFITLGLVVTPFIHRILHKWHLDSE
ncbi:MULTISPECIES: hypothetical protein [Photorhabdus]|uniref:hypothetical protein n=1 Tax=Photorhabdus TaxID=29487 RepID=UPI0007B4CDFB|nr:MULTISPECIES: hypothetical protein [Photorhabdus]AWK41825.1 hypothetical protein A4R40_10180 [Photorhabdus laumondii subsp. laumondii]AXG42688.1 hypothetical protein PluDJC_10845 [Photorhabdus laumondii subsp. laumondii]MCC8388818.1 hypothetical protein [Photorhabdus laumondii]MCZ1250187.1 hypothetical protein [Photorhabdus laumondii subsp. laumondii]NDL14969.1 hypothetical protein [Photorhabdus laumondii subsp. laumondii]